MGLYEDVKRVGDDVGFRDGCNVDPERSRFTLVGDIDWEAVKPIIREIERTDFLPRRIVVKIATNGGSITQAITLYSVLKHARDTGSTVETIAVGPVRSAGVLIWAVGRPRTLREGAYLLFHPVNAEGVFSHVEMTGTVDETEYYIALLSEALGVPVHSWMTNGQLIARPGQSGIKAGHPTLDTN